MMDLSPDNMYMYRGEWGFTKNYFKFSWGHTRPYESPVCVCMCVCVCVCVRLISQFAIHSSSVAISCCLLVLAQECLLQFQEIVQQFSQQELICKVNEKHTSIYHSHIH